MVIETLNFPVQEVGAVHHAPAVDRERRRLAGSGTTGLGAPVLRVGDDVVTIDPGDEVTVRDGCRDARWLWSSPTADPNDVDNRRLRDR